MKENVRVDRSLTIPADELRFSFTTSGGPGGQHANRSSTRVVLTWNVDDSAVLGPRQRQRIRTALKGRIDSAGNLRIASDRHRSQTRNRQDAVHRLAVLVADALRPRRSRVATAPTGASRERRLRAKRARSDVKRQRRAPHNDE